MLDLFSGIGGFALAAEWVWGDELEIVAFCEKDEYCRKVLNKHWPKVAIEENVREIKRRYKDVDLITGGFPCQPFSQAGKRDGRSDDRYLWPEMLRVIRLFQPAWIVAENVRGLLSIEDGVVFEQVCADLEDSGYAVQPFVIPAVAVDAPHRRDRVWIVGHGFNSGLERHTGDDNKRNQPGWHRTNADRPISPASLSGSLADTQGRTERTRLCESEQRGERRGRFGDGCCEARRWFPEPDVGRMAHGVPCRVDRLRALGNAIVPQVAEQIFRAIRSVTTNTANRPEGE